MRAGRAHTGLEHACKSASSDARGGTEGHGAVPKTSADRLHGPTPLTVASDRAALTLRHHVLMGRSAYWNRAAQVLSVSRALGRTSVRDERGPFDFFWGSCCRAHCLRGGA